MLTEMLSHYRDAFTQINLTVIVDILLVSWVIYQLLILLKGTRAAQLVKGLLILLAVFQASDWLHLYTFHWLLGQMLIPGVVALVILFQPELRLALEQMGQGRFFPGTSGPRGRMSLAVNEIVGSVEYLSNRKYGAIIALENRIGLQDIIETGKRIDGVVTASLLNTVFHPGSPLHDGAVVIRGYTICAAGCILPLSNRSVPVPARGLRHRAALGLSEIGDALVIVVSEETGSISIAQAGTMKSGLRTDALRDHLLSMMQPTVRDTSSHRRRKQVDGPRPTS